MDFPPEIGGVANYWGNLLLNLPEDKVVVLAPENDNSLDFDVKQKYVVYRRRLLTTSSRVWPRWWPYLWQVYRLCRVESPEQIIVGQVLPGGTIAWLMKKILNIPYILSFHGLDISMAQMTKRRKKWFRFLVNSASKIIVNSDFTKQKLILVMGTVKAPIEIVYPCASILPLNEYSDLILNDFVDRYSVKNKKIILSVGRLVERKGFDQMIRVVSNIRRKMPFIHYFIVGRGPDKNRLESIVVHHNAEKYVTILSDVSDDELPYFYKLADLFVMLPRELADGDVEGFGIVFLEANLFHLPVLAGNSGGVPEAVENNVSGVLVDSSDIMQIQQAAESLLKNDENRRLMGDLGFERAQRLYNWPAQAKRLEAFLG